MEKVSHRQERFEACEALMRIDLDAIAANWTSVKRFTADCEVASVVKADAYGLGLAKVSKRLFAAGCRTFFVALGIEGLALRESLGSEVAIYVLNGFDRTVCDDFVAAALRPVLNDSEEVSLYAQMPSMQAVGAALMVDTGMNRLGVSLSEALSMGPLPRGCELVLSHLIEPERIERASNARQKERFAQLDDHFTGFKASLSSSGGVGLGRDFVRDLVRIGIGLYGVRGRGFPGAVHQSVQVEAPVLSLRSLARGDTVGYQSTYRADGPMRVATLGVGYADGVSRNASSGIGGEPRGFAAFRGVRLPIVGRVSMDSTVVDVTRLDANEIRRGERVELLGPTIDLAEAAELCGEVPHSLLTRYGYSRIRRVYTSGADHGQA